MIIKINLSKRNSLISQLLLITYCFFFSVLINFLLPTFSSAQDIHFSQFTQSPLFLNPALTGGFNGDQRGIINYKNQWQSISSPYRTYMVSYDAGLMKKKWKTNFLGVGFTAFRDKAGDAQLGVTQFNLSFADFVLISTNQQISAGLQGGYAQNSYDYSKLKWGNQFNGLSYDPTLPSRENEATDFSFWDISAGMSWSYSSSASTLSSNDAFRANAGVAVYHVNRPRQNFYANDADRLYQKIVVHATTYIGFTNTNYAVLPSFLFLRQGPFQEINVGLLYRQILMEESRYTQFVNGAAFYLGGQYRVGDSFVPSIMLEMGSMNVGISYDLNVSKLKAASNVRGGIEISLRIINPNPFHYKGASKGNVRFL